MSFTKEERDADIVPPRPTTLDDALDRCALESVRLGLDEHGAPYLKWDGPSKGLLSLLKAHKEEVIEFLRSARLREWMMPSGFVYREGAGSSHYSIGRYDIHPEGFGLWRFQGEETWQVVEGRDELARMCLDRLRGDAPAALPVLARPLPAAGAQPQRPLTQSVFLDGPQRQPDHGLPQGVRQEGSAGPLRTDHERPDASRAKKRRAK